MKQLCSRCILDTTVNDNWFDENGECKYCKIHDEMEKNHTSGLETETELNKIINKIKLQGKNKKYDCIAGISGGRDSTYTLYTAVKLGLRPLQYILIMDGILTFLYKILKKPVRD